MEHDLAVGIVWYVVFVYSTVCHEAAHAWASHRLGDDTAYRGGQVTLDPIPHIRREPIGMVVMPIVSFLANGWVIGWASAPYDPEWALRYPRRSALMAIAGPAANLLIALVSAILIIVGGRAGVFEPGNGTLFQMMTSGQLITSGSGTAWQICAQVLSIAFCLNVLLCIFNLLPLPPMDGSAIPLFFLKERAAEAYQRMMWQPMMQIFGFLVAMRGFGGVFFPIFIPIVKSVYRAMQVN